MLWRLKVSILLYGVFSCRLKIFLYLFKKKKTMISTILNVHIFTEGPLDFFGKTKT